MICPKCRTDVPPEAAKCPGCALVTPRGKELEIAEKKRKAEQKKNAKKFLFTRAQRGPKPSFNLKSINWKDPRSWASLGAMIPSWAIYLALGVLLLGGGYFAYGYVYSPPAKEKAASVVQAINQTKNRPAKKAGSTIDQNLKEMLAKSKESGQLVNYQGWSAKTKDHGAYLVTFAYEEKDGQKEAAWLVDLANNQFVPQTELALALSR